MSRYIALLRGINISGKNKIPMAELKDGFKELGQAEVSTYLNSGNVIFSAAEKDETALTDKIREIIQDRFALEFAEAAMRIAPCYYVTGNHEARISEYDTSFPQTGSDFDRAGSIFVALMIYDLNR